MEKASEEVTKDPKRQERCKKSHETYMKRLKEKIIEDNQLPTPSTTDGPTPSTPSSTPPTTSCTGDPTPSTRFHGTRSNYTYVYGVGILAVLAIGVCVFFTFQSKNKKLVNKKQDQPPHPQSLSLKNLYNK